MIASSLYRVSSNRIDVFFISSISRPNWQPRSVLPHPSSATPQTILSVPESSFPCSAVVAFAEGDVFAISSAATMITTIARSELMTVSYIAKNSVSPCVGVAYWLWMCQYHEKTVHVCWSKNIIIGTWNSASGRQKLIVDIRKPKSTPNVTMDMHMLSIQRHLSSRIDSCSRILFFQRNTVPVVKPTTKQIGTTNIQNTSDFEVGRKGGPNQSG